MLLLCFHGLDTSIGAQCNVIPSLMFANYHVDAAKWNVTIVWSEMERKCDSVVMKSAINKGLEDMKTVDVQICETFNTIACMYTYIYVCVCVRVLYIYISLYLYMYVYTYT